MKIREYLTESFEPKIQKDPRKKTRIHVVFSQPTVVDTLLAFIQDEVDLPYKKWGRFATDKKSFWIDFKTSKDAQSFYEKMK